MIYQDDDHSCGLAVTRNLLIEITKDRAYGSEIFKSSCDTFFKIQKELETRGIKSEGYLVDEAGLMKIDDPFIAQFKTEVGYHFVLVRRKRNGFKIIDSGRGKYYLSFKDFNKQFTGRVLEVKESNPVKAKKKKFLKRQEKACLVFLSFFELAFVSFALYFTDEEKHALLMLSFFLLMAVTMAIKKWYILNIYRSTDRRFLLPYLYKTKEKKNFEKLARIRNQRIKQFTDFLLLLESFILISCYVIFLDRFIFFTIFSSIVINTILYFIVKPREKRSFALTLKEERGFMDVVDTNGTYDELFNRYLRSTKESNKILLIELIRKGISIFSVAMMVLCAALIKNNYSPVFLIFNFFFVSYFTDLVVRILDSAIRFDPYLVAFNSLNLKEELGLLDKSEVLGYN